MLYNKGFLSFIAICQLRLDFTAFDLTEVAATGLCTDVFAVTGTTGKNPDNLCGTLTGSHCKKFPIAQWSEGVTKPPMVIEVNLRFFFKLFGYIFEQKRVFKHF